MDEGNFQPQNKINESIDWEYKRNMRRYAISLEDLERRGKLGYGPTYYMESRARLPYTIEVYLRNLYIRGNPSFLLLCKDTSGSIVGTRTETIDEMLGGNYEAYGNIRINEKGKGISTLLDIALLDILQREANKIKHSIDWTIKDQNVTDLNNLINDGNPVLAEEVTTKIEERARWEHNYSPNGIFGFSSTGVKTIDPKPGTNNDILKIKTIKIERSETAPLGAVVLEDLVDDMEKYHQERKKELEKTVARMKKLAQ